MKTKLILVAVLMSLMSCDQNYIASSLPNEVKIVNNEDWITNFSEISKEFLGKSNSEQNGKEVLLYSELVELFDPDKLQCGLSPEIKQRLKAVSRNGESKLGHVPDVIYNNIGNVKKVIKLDGRGASILAHYFTYEKKDKSISKPIISVNTPTQTDFNISLILNKDKATYDNFFFTLDCSGYFSASAKAAAKKGFLGFGKIDIAAEGENTIDKNKSVVIIKSLVYSPLYSAYKGTGIYNASKTASNKLKKEILIQRIATLNGILEAIPKQHIKENSEIFLNVNYEAIIASNKGNSGYNGNGSLDSNVELAFSIVESKTGIKSKNSISRKSEYSNYDTYIIDMNIDATPDKLTMKDLNELINSLETEVEKLTKN